MIITCVGLLLQPAEQPALDISYVATPPSVVYAYVIATASVFIQAVLAKFGIGNRDNGPRFRYWFGLLLVFPALSYLVGEVYRHNSARGLYLSVKASELCGITCQYDILADLELIHSILNMGNCMSVALALLAWALRRPKEAE